MVIIFLGAPGSGKGTQSKKVVEHFGIPQLSTGDILRQSIAKKTEVGLLAKKIMEAGELVPDEIILKIMSDLLNSDYCKNGFILDGFPRNIKQAESLDILLKQKKIDVSLVLYLSLDKDMLIERLSGRRISEMSGREYHIKFNPPKVDGVCDIDGSKLLQRPDDHPEQIINRFKVYENFTFPLVEYYKERKLLKEIDASKDFNQVTMKIFQSIELIGGLI